MTTTRITRMPVSELAPADYNPRSITPDAMAGLQKSIGRFGLVELIVWNQRTRTVVSGHQRLKALQAAGENETDVIVVDLELTEEKALNVAMNNPAIAGDFTTDLQALLVELHQVDEALYSDLMFETMVVDDAPEVERGDPDAMPEKPPPIAQLGDLWLLGDHRVVCGSSGDPATFDRLFDGATPTLLCTDPPYGVTYTELARRCRGGGHANADWTNIANDDLAGDDLAALLAVALDAPGAHTAIVWIPPALKGPRLVFQNALPKLGWDMRQEIIWAKNHFNFGMADYHWQHESALYCKRAGAPRLEDRTQSTLWSIDRTTGMKHPTQKPVELFARGIRNHTAAGDIVFDPFLGSGTCLLAAEQEGRRCYGVELEPRYVDLQVERWQQYTGQKAQRLR